MGAYHRNHWVGIAGICNRYAPAWKTMEFVTFGGVLSVFKSLKSEEVKKTISKHYDINNIHVFENYIHSIIQIRNVCAHGAALFDFTLEKSIRNGPALKITNQNKNKLSSVFAVILYVLNKISENREKDMRKEINALFRKYADDDVIKSIIEHCIGYKYVDLLD